VKRWGPSVGKVDEWCVESRHLQGCSRHLCRLRTDGLGPVSKYWTYRSHDGDMGLISLVVCRRQMLGFALTDSRLARERNWVRTCRSVSRRAVDCVRSPFSWEQWSYSTLSMTRERLSHTGTTRRKHTSGVHGLTWEAYVSYWSSFFPAGCTSIQIATTLRYE
jgi:hypothetical protein